MTLTVVLSCIIMYIPFTNNVYVIMNFKNAAKIIHYFTSPDKENMP